MSDDSSLLDVSRCHRDLMEGAHQVDFEEYLHVVELVMEVMDVGDRVSVRLGDPVESSVVAARSPLIGSGFGDHVKR